MTIEQVREKFKGAYVSSYEIAQKGPDGKYLSHRNDEYKPLVCQELNVLTVEDYDKWYGLYYLMEDPDTKEIMLVTLAWGDILEGIDHEFYPDAVIRFCIANNIVLDAVSLECICKSLMFYREDLYDNHLPPIMDMYHTKTLVLYESISRTFYVHGKYLFTTGLTKMNNIP